MSKYETNIGEMARNMEKISIGLKWKTLLLDGLLMMMMMMMGCCNPDGQVSQRSQVPQLCQLDTSRPWEPLVIDGQEPERHGTYFAL